MIRLLASGAVSLALALPAMAASHGETEIPEETQARIMDMLADMNCQMDADDIETTEEGGYDLDDVICEGGNQFDIALDADHNEIGRRAE